MSHVMCTQYKQHKQALKVRWSECKVQLKQKDNNCSSLCIIHSEPEDASRMYFGINFTVIAVMLLTIVIVTVAMAIVTNILQKVCAIKIISPNIINSSAYIGVMKDEVFCT